VALFRERRLPFRVQRALDKLCNTIGLRYKKVSVKGFTIKLRRLTTDEDFVHNILVNEEYNPAGYEISEADTVIDIGGNIGTFSLLAARRASKGRVFTFEPVSENYQLLLRNIRLNRISNIVPNKLAVLDERKKVTIYLNASNTGCHSVFRSYGTNPAHWFEVVDAVTLRDVLEENHIDRCHFLKLDCEGSEYQIIYGLPKEYFARIDRIAMEYHTTNSEQVGAQADQLVAYLQRVGYRIDAYLSYGGGGFIRARRISA
jgi:FkbM family methyltransferase